MPTTNICKLCNDNLADKTNSHIISLFIIASLLTKEGKARYREINATISQSSLSKFYFGRDILPEKIEELTGRQLTDKEIKDNDNPYTVDHLLCTSCETKLQRLEDFIAKDIYNNFYRIPTKIEGEHLYKDLGIDKYIAFKFFFLSIVWRVSLAFKDGKFSLCPPFEEKVRDLLYRNLSLNANDLKQNIQNAKSEIENYPFIIFCQENTNNGEQKTDNFINFYPFSEAPYYATINEFIICFFYKRKSIGKDPKKPKKYFGLEKLLANKGFNTIDNCMAIRVLSEKEYSSFKKDMIDFLVINRFKTLRAYFITIYKQIFISSPSEKIIDGFMKKLILENEGKLDKYSIPNFAKAMHMYIQSISH